MRIVRASMRLSLFGGGCDLPEYYQAYGATIISCAIDKSIYLVHNKHETGGFRLTYNKVEELQNLKDAEHSLVRQAASLWSIKKPCTLSIVSDLPKGTGLGSSSALAVALTLMFYPNYLSQPDVLAHEAYELERKTAAVGVQDHLPAAWGGFRIYHIETDGNIEASDRILRLEDIITGYGLVLYTKRTRPAVQILPNWTVEIRHLCAIHDLACCVEQEIPTMTAQRLGLLLHETWKLKQRVNGVIDGELARQYEAARDAGAVGGKLIGAGGGGCWFFIADPSKFYDIVNATGTVSIPFSVSSIGHNDVHI